ncbi:hypothetical protein L6164_012759 [Bauhinia variegata]|uniref:Uncharacterized protein n=1 Tax=Bauhinia variegata TaxID=167791 RepID=A0ACB9PA15_BAUVA|nr:hypothetical protein L6164_012759 [Bauhinia variegata]
MATAILAFLLTSMILLSKGSHPLLLQLRLSPTASCTDELASFSPCLPYVSSPPNNLSDTANATCCKAFSSAFISGIAFCFCQLLQDPPIFGFPLNNTRLLSLSSVCPPTDGTSSSIPTLDFLCTGSGSTGSRSARMAPHFGRSSPARSSLKSGHRSLAIAFKGAARKGFSRRHFVAIHNSSGNRQIRSSKSLLLVGMLSILAFAIQC